MVRADADWPRLQQVPNLTDGWPDVKDKFGIAMEEFKVGCPQAQGSARQKLSQSSGYAAEDGLEGLTEDPSQQPWTSGVMEHASLWAARCDSVLIYSGAWAPS